MSRQVVNMTETNPLATTWARTGKLFCKPESENGSEN